MGILKRAPALLLKTTPPRVAHGFLDRERLQLSRLEATGSQVTAVLAPTGFGKTAQLNHWRREALAKGGLAFWLTLDSKDDPQQLIRGLSYCAHAASGKRGFGEEFMQWIDECSDPHEAITGWLAEVANLSVETVLLLDDVDRLPSQTRTEALTYLLGNAPSNLHIALAARPAGALVASGTLRTTRVTRITASDLRFRADETLAVLSSALGSRCNLDAAAALHDSTEGWPFGVQLAAAALYRSGDIASLMSAATSDIRRYFVDTVINSQSTDAVHLLVRLANFDLIHPHLCSAALGRSDLEHVLIELRNETPLLSQAEDSDWMRLHPLAREALRGRLLQLPQEERQAMSQKASEWYASHELYEEAAEQSFLAGDIKTAFDLVGRSTYEMTVKGKSSAVLAWYRRLSEDALHKYPSFWPAAAWGLAMSEHSREAQPLIELMLAQPQISAAERFEAALIEVTAAGFADRIDTMAEKLVNWPEPPLTARVSDIPIYLIGKSFVDMCLGQPDQARQHLAQIANLDQQATYSPVSYGLADYGVGLSYLWEGRYALAEQALRSALHRAEESLSRHHPVTGMIAALLNQACWESAHMDDAGAMLAGRLSLLEHQGLPDALIAAYTTLAHIAEHEGRQDQALNLLESLCSIGQARAMLRLQVVAKFELTRLHARYGRADSAMTLSRALDVLLRDHESNMQDIFIPWLQLHADLARAYAILATQDECPLSDALSAAESALLWAISLKRGREEVEARLLRAEVLRRQGATDSRTALIEAVSLAQASGMLRLLREAQAEHKAITEPIAGHVQDASAIVADDHYMRGAALLTAKEREVLALLSRNMSNKEIARAMVVSDETIKWHMKNLFSKFNAAGRKHVVARARMLGLLD